MALHPVHFNSRRKIRRTDAPSVVATLENAKHASGIEVMHHGSRCRWLTQGSQPRSQSILLISMRTTYAMLADAIFDALAFPCEAVMRNCYQPVRSTDVGDAPHLSSWTEAKVPSVVTWTLAALAVTAAAMIVGPILSGLEPMADIFAENGPVEFIQAACLGLVALIFALAYVHADGARGLFCLLAIVGVVMATTREIPRCDSVFYGEGMCLTTVGKDTTIAIAGALALVAVFCRPPRWREALDLGNIRWTWPALLTLPILLLAEGFEHFGMEQFEEPLEFAAYAYLGAFAVFVLRAGDSRRP